MTANQLMYYTPAAIELSDIRHVAEHNRYRCTALTLKIENGREYERLNVHFTYETPQKTLAEYFWVWHGGTRYGFASMTEDLALMEAWRRARFEERQPASAFFINYSLFSLPYMVPFLLLVFKSYHGWVEDAFSATMYTLATIESLPQNTADYLRAHYDESGTPKTHDR